jgi:multimeric flavodoxin WrbA
MPNVAVIYYSPTGNVHALVQAVAQGAAEEGAEVRLRRVAELAPRSAIESNPAWRANAEATAGVPVATHEDLRWADGITWGAIVVAPGYTDAAVASAGGNPYGTAHPSGDGLPGERALEAARHQGRRLARVAALVAGRERVGAGADR